MLGGLIEREGLGEMERRCRGKREGIEGAVTALGEMGERATGHGTVQGEKKPSRGRGRICQVGPACRMKKRWRGNVRVCLLGWMLGCCPGLAQFGMFLSFFCSISFPYFCFLFGLFDLFENNLFGFKFCKL
jgi:hypothetical protein